MTALPNSHFPDYLDDDLILCEVSNTCESPLIKELRSEDDELWITPRDWDTPEKWSRDGGFVNVEGEVIYYSTVVLEYRPNVPDPINPDFDYLDDPNVAESDKDHYRRTIKLGNLIRGVGQFGSRYHSVGEWVRGYVMAEHHNLLKKAVGGMEQLIGVDNSMDHRSIDYRLRDLEELVVEEDDLECPYGVFWYEVLSQNDFSKTIQFHISIIGAYDSYEFVPREGATSINDNLNPIYTYNIYENVGASLVVRKESCCSCMSENSVPCEPCQIKPSFQDLAVLECPQIDTWEIPIIPPVACPEIICPVCEPCVTTTCPIATTPTATTIVPTLPTMITINIPDITLPPIPTMITVSITVQYPETVAGSNAEGACFRIVPCSGTTS